MRTIALMRHAKAEAHGPTDFERVLDPRGRADAAAAGVWLAAQGFTPDHALVSAASRTRETWACLAGGAGWDGLEPDYDRGMYAAEPDTALDLVTRVDDAVRALLVIGHNPTMAYLAQVLSDGEGGTDLEGQLLGGFPTSAMAVFEYDGSWTDLAEGAARLIGYHVGRR